MKLKVLSVLTSMGLAAGAFGQQVILDNLGNSGNATATSNGQIYEQVGASTTIFDMSQYNIGVTVLGGSSLGSLTPMGSFTPTSYSKGYTGVQAGQFQLGSSGLGVSVPGVLAGGTVFIELQIWDYDSPNATGTFATYLAAVAGNDYHADVVFQNPTSNPTGAPPVPAQELTGMPSVTLSQVPEPTTIALAGLGIASLLAVRRRKA